ncbi:hypothetical protein EMCG_03476 [[Emmonsia] crescens]|uniref:GST C-terminal domain-containing protein n=1 Tax=[Emmonsia] crescens TaxID=73230 RepID=A0A0G2HW75_9EURO|nr:hypothetical protein EMCG_03476 [Emmonsia crescens UAMH 3008]
MSGQGPYFGHAFWFRNNHPEKVPSALGRYENETRRVCRVLGGWLAGELGAGSGEDGGGRERKNLVGEKYSIADLTFIPCQGYVKGLIDAGAYGESDEKKEFPHMQTWFERLRGREAVKEVFAEKEANK